MDDRAGLTSWLLRRFHEQVCSVLRGMGIPHRQEVPSPDGLFSLDIVAQVQALGCAGSLLSGSGWSVIMGERAALRGAMGALGVVHVVLCSCTSSEPPSPLPAGTVPATAAIALTRVHWLTASVLRL